MLPLGTELPSFELPDVGGGCWSTSELDDRPLLVLFICAHCPYVKHVEASLTALAADFAATLQIVAISSNNNSIKRINSSTDDDNDVDGDDDDRTNEDR